MNLRFDQFDFIDTQSNFSCYSKLLVVSVAGGGVWGIPIKRQQLNSLSSFVYPPHRKARMLWLLKYLGLPYPSSNIRCLEPSFTRKLDELTGVNQVATSFYIGAEGAYRKSLFFLSSCKGENLVVKMATVQLANTAIDHEAMNLMKLSELEDIRGSIPKLISTGIINGMNCVVMKPVLGKFGGFSLKNLHWNFVRQLFNASLQEYTWSESPFRDHIVNMLNPLPHSVKKKYLPVISFLDKSLGKRLLSFGWAHRDFAPWNIKMLNNQIQVMDWEIALPYAPPGYDILHFLAVQSALKNKSIKWPVRELGMWLQGFTPLWSDGEVFVLITYLLDQLLYYMQARVDNPAIGSDKILNWLSRSLDEVLADVT